MADVPRQGVFQVLEQLKELWGKQPKRRKTLAMLVALGVLAWVGYTTFAKHAESWTPVGEGASPDDVQEMYASLQSRDIPSHLRDGKLEVASDRADEARAIISGAGLPHAGKGYELFDGTNLGQSHFTEEVNYRRALQGELARSITALAQVAGARVHLALGKKSVFKDQQEAPSASVALHLHAGQTLTAEQVRGVRQLVAASIEGMKPEAVAIVDNHGNLLDANDPGAVDRKAEIERTVTSRVRAMLERVVGAGKVSVVATADVDYHKINQTEEIYDKDRAAIRSETKSVDGGDAVSGVGGIAGARGNLPGAAAASGSGSAAAPGRLQETKNYEITHTVRQTQGPEAQLVKLHLAVLVDYKTVDGKPVPHTDKELAELTAVARQAAGLDDTRGDKLEMHSIPFAPSAEPADAPVPVVEPSLPMMYVATGGGAMLLLLIVIGVLLAKRKRKRTATETKARTLALPVPVAELERMMESKPANAIGPGAELPGLPPGKPVQERVLDVVRGDVERAAGVITAWLAEPEPKPQLKGAKS
jgi:flagellar M-ring protein FliF